MKNILLPMMAIVATVLNMQAQPPSDSTPTYPQGATYTHSSGTATITSDYSSSTQYYNVIQCTGGTLTMNGCTITKTGDGSGGDNSSFYGNNSSIYCGAASSSNYQSTTAASGAKIVMKDVTVNSSSKGANAVIATNGATVEIDGITIVNNNSVSRGLHATYGGIINASNVDITTNEATSSTIATDRGGGTVTVNGGTITAKGSKSSVLYSTGTITVDCITGTSEKGPMATVEGANYVTIRNSTMTSHSDARGILLHQSNSGDAEGTKPVCTVTGSTLTTTDSSAPLCFVTNVTGTLTLTDVTLSVASGKLMSVEYYKRGTGSTGTLELRTTKNAWDYTGTVDADNVNNVAVSVGENVTWNGAANSAGAALSAAVTVNKGAVWNLTANTTLTNLVNNGTINKNGYTLTYSSLSGSGTINETTGIEEVRSRKSDGRDDMYTLDGRRANASVKGIVIQDGKKVVKK